MPSIAHFQQAVESLIAESCPRLARPTRTRLVFWLVGIMVAGTIVSRRIASTHAQVQPTGADPSSHERRLRRIVTDPRLTWATTYARVVRRILGRGRWTTCTVIIDESGHTDRVRVLTAALWYRGRALPLAWRCWAGGVPHEHTYWTDCATLLARVATVLPPGVAVTVVGDRAFGCPGFTDLVASYGWEWLVRVQGQTRLRHPDGSEQALQAVVQTAGQWWCGRGQVFKKQGWRSVSVVIYWRVGCAGPLLLVRSHAPQWSLVSHYRQRSAIEALFRDWKSSGWQWEASHVQRLAGQEQIVLGLAWATLLTLCLGAEAATMVRATVAGRSPRRPWAARDSLFRLGRDQLWRRLWSGDTRPIVWDLAHPDAPTWSHECWRLGLPEGAVVRMTGRVVPREGRRTAEHETVRP